MYLTHPRNWLSDLLIVFLVQARTICPVETTEHFLLPHMIQESRKILCGEGANACRRADVPTESSGLGSGLPKGKRAHSSQNSGCLPRQSDGFCTRYIRSLDRAEFLHGRRGAERRVSIEYVHGDIIQARCRGRGIKIFWNWKKYLTMLLARKWSMLREMGSSLTTTSNAASGQRLQLF